MKMSLFTRLITGISFLLVLLNLALTCHIIWG